MEIKITTKQLLYVLNILSWIIFVGLCIDAGGVLTNTLYSLLYNPLAAAQFWYEIDLSSLLDYDKGYFITETILMSIVAVMKATLFYLIIKIVHDNKVDFIKPFNIEMQHFVSNVSYLALGIGLFSSWGQNYTKWLVEKGIAMPDIQSLRLGGADVWLFMGITLLIIAQIFKRGVEIQSENELTI